MDKSNIKDCIVLYNPVSTGFKEKDKDNAMKVIQSHGIKPYCSKSLYEGHLTKLVQEYDEENRLILTMGGDGTVGEAYEAFNKNYGQKGIYAHIPTGTANDMAKNYDVKHKEPKAIIEDILNGEVKMLDTYSLNDKIVAYTSVFGYFSHIPYVTPSKLKKNLKYTGYLLRALEELIKEPRDILKPNTYNISYSIDEKCETDDFILGAVSNSKGFAGINIFDNAKLDDGKIEMLLIKKLPAKVVLSILKDFLKDDICLKKYEEYIVMKQASEIKLTFNETFPKYPIDIDGENSKIIPNYKDPDLIFKTEAPVRVMKTKI